MSKKKKEGTGGREIATAYKLLVVQERLKGTPEKEVADAFGVSAAAVTKWTNAFRRHGPSALASKRGRGGKTGLRPLKQSVKADRVVALKKEHETWGSRRIADVLARFEALGVSEHEVRKILHAEGLIDSPPTKKEREHPPRRFERATPNQLWQSDIFTFRLRRAERLYVCVFMDDHSRFVVGHSLAHHQKSALVMEAFERGFAAYGQPTEVLTDNGRQYTVWRGKTEFEEQLRRLGIHHIRSRPQHPQTLGKVERFWKTLWDEFLGRTVFAHVVDAQRRLEHFISHYNFQRPHQALDGLVPADRFFKAAAHVRAEIERAVAQNELRLALEQPPRKPFYVVGQLGDQRLSISAGATGLEVHVGDKSETIPLKEEPDATSTARNFIEEETQEPTDSDVAGEEVGPGRSSEKSRDARLVGAVRGEARDERDRGRWDLARLLLSTGDQGAQRDAARASAGLGQRREPGRDGTAASDQAARGQALESRSSAAASGADAIRASQADDAWSGEDAPWSAAEDTNALDAGWAEKLALLDDDEREHEHEINEALDQAASFESIYDRESGNWRERGPERWERKLAGADAPSDNLSDDEDPNVHASSRASRRPGAAAPLHGDRGRDFANADRQRSGEHAGLVSQSLPDAVPPSARCDDRSDDAQASGPTSEAGEGSGARSGERALEGRARSDHDAHRSDRADAEGGGWLRVRCDAPAASARQEEQAGGSVTDEEGHGEGHA
jgi:transposase InsO family protein